MRNSTALVLLLISAGILYTFVLPEWSAIGMLQDQASQYSNVLASVQTLESKRDQLLVQYKNIPADQLDEIQKILPSNIDTVNLALDVNTIASRYGVAIKSVSTDAGSGVSSGNVIGTEAVSASSSPAFQTAFVTFTFTSNYDNFRKILSDLETSLRILDVQEVAFKVGATGNLYDFSVSVETYWTQ
jgi:hypothetical protein